MTELYKYLLAGAIAALTACGAKTTGDEGSESHWLKECANDDQCVVGSCWCGRCTERCDVVTECPHPLNQCSVPGTGVFDETCEVPKGGLCGVFDESTLESVHALSQKVATSCDEGRSSLLSVATGMWGQRRAIARSENEYYLFASGATGVSGTADVIRVDTKGNVLQLLPAPSNLYPSLDDLLPLDEGRVALSGKIASPGGAKAWVGVVDANWQLVWERELGSTGVLQVDLARLSGGGLVVAAPSYDYDDQERQSLTMSRLDLDGNSKWETELDVDGYVAGGWLHRYLAADGERARVVLQTTEGLVVVTPDESGVLTATTLETRLASDLAGVAALPNGRLAIASPSVPGAILTVVEADGSVVWEKGYGRAQNAEAYAVTYDPTRDQLVVAGGYRGEDGSTTRTWMIGTDLEGEQQWELTRLPQETEGDGLVSAVSPKRGPGLQDVTVGPDGTLLAVGRTTFDLSFFVVGQESCD